METKSKVFCQNVLIGYEWKRSKQRQLIQNFVIRLCIRYAVTIAVNHVVLQIRLKSNENSLQ